MKLDTEKFAEMAFAIALLSMSLIAVGTFVGAMIHIISNCGGK